MSTKLLKYERQQIIRNLVESNGIIKLIDLEDRLDTKRLTIQRDLLELEQKGILSRIHGGAVLKDQEFTAKLKIIREKENMDIKLQMGQKACSFIQETDTIALDPSTTVETMTNYLPDFQITVFTPSIDIFQKLLKYKNLNPIISGGQYNHKTQTLAGLFTIENIKKFSFSKCFMSSNGFDPLRGTIEFDIDDSIVKTAMTEVSEEIILLIDGSKISNKKGIFVCPIEKISHIITDFRDFQDWPEDVQKKLILI